MPACSVLPSQVTTEHVLGERAGRADVHVTLGDSELIIENKVTAALRKGQIQRYCSTGHHVGVISTSFETGAVLQELGLQVPHIGLEELERLAAPFAHAHWLLGEHYGWLRSQLAERESIRRQAASEDLEHVRRVLANRYGQWAMMEYLTSGGAPHSFSGIPRCGLNRGGAPWTEFWFAGPPPSQRDNPLDTIFYRIDKYSSGQYYLSVRQYQKIPYPSQDAKQRRLRQLRDWWRDAHLQAGPSEFEPRHHKRVTGSETEIAYYLLLEPGARPWELRTFLPAVHSRFGDVIRAHGWNLL